MKRIYAAALAFMMAGAALAHHSTAMYDFKKKVKFENALVKQWIWKNPHISLIIEVPSKAGESQSWLLEGSGPTHLVNIGWKRTDVKVGDKITVILHPGRDGKHHGVISEVFTAQGKHLESMNLATGQGARRKQAEDDKI